MSGKGKVFGRKGWKADNQHSLKTEQVVLSSSDPRHDIGTVAYLRLQDARLVSKSDTPADPLALLHVPPLLDEDAEAMYKALQPHDRLEESITPEGSRASDTTALKACSGGAGPWLSVGNIVSARHTAEEQMEECFATLKRECLCTGP